MKESSAPDIQGMPQFSGLHENARRYLQTRLRRFFFKPGQQIIQRGRKGQFMGLVGHGLFDLEKADGTIQTLLPGEVLGEQMLRLDQPCPYTVRARTDASLWVITRSDWLAAVQMAPTVKPPKRRTNKRKRNLFWIFGVLVLFGAALVFLSPELPNVANRALMQAFWQANRTDLAESYISLLLRFQPDTPSLYEELGFIYFQRGDYQKSVEAYENAVSSDQVSASALNNLGVSLLSISKPAQAIPHLLAATDLDPGNAEIFFNLGNAYQVSGDRESAVDAYRRAAELDPAFLDSKIQLASLLIDLGDLEGARTIWEEVLSQVPGLATALKGRGIIAVLEGRPQEALIDLNAVLSAYPVDDVAHLYVGLAMEALGNLDSAATEFEAVQMLTSDAAMIELAEAHLQEIVKSYEHQP